MTANNTSANDTMVTELADLVAHFGGKSMCMRCFLHVINLVVKTVIKVFNLPKKEGDKGWEILEHKLKTLEETDLEEYLTQTEMGADTDRDLEDDNMNEWINELEFLTDEELAELDDYLKPLHMMLAKVSVH